MLKFYPPTILAIIGAALLKISVFYPPDFFVNSGPAPLFQLFEALFLAKEVAQNVEILPTHNFGHF